MPRIPPKRDPPPLLGGLRKSGVAKERITDLTIEAVMQHYKSAAITTSAIKDATVIVRYCIDFRPDEKVALTGESSLVLIRDYLEQAATRGRTVPAAIRRSLY